MAEVQAVKDQDTIRLIGHLLNRRYSQQMADIWNIGINLALRISDLLAIRFDDITDGRLLLQEQKTGKQASILLNPKANKIISRIHEEHPEHIYLFQSYRSRQSKNKEPKPLSRRAVGKAFELIGEEIGLSLGTHSMRKTRGYHLYQSTKDLASCHEDAQTQL